MHAFSSFERRSFPCPFLFLPADLVPFRFPIPIASHFIIGHLFSYSYSAFISSWSYTCYISLFLFLSALFNSYFFFPHSPLILPSCFLIRHFLVFFSLLHSFLRLFLFLRLLHISIPSSSPFLPPLLVSLSSISSAEIVNICVMPCDRPIESNSSEFHHQTPSVAFRTNLQSVFVQPISRLQSRR